MGVFSALCVMTESSLTVAGLYKNLIVIANFVTEWAIEAGLGERAVYAVQMAVDEACSNIIEHAYGGEGKGDIHLQCQSLNDGLQITITDLGAGFEPDAVSAPNLHAPLEERDSGGLGLFLMKQLMDEVKFNFSETGNILVMVKKQDPHYDPPV